MSFFLRSRVFVFGGVLLALSALRAVAEGSSEIALAGSDLLKGKCAAVLQKSAAEIPGGVALTLDGSLMAEKYLRAKRADAALLIIPDKQKEKIPELASGEWKALPVAFQTAVFVVNSLNSVEQIDFGTLTGIYSAFSLSDVRHWSKVPGSGLDMPIFSFMTRDDAGISTLLFRFQVLKNEEFRSEVSIRGGNSAVEADVSANTNAIGCLSMPPQQGRVRVLAVAGEKGKSAYLPTPENLYNGDYPLVVPVYLVFPERNRAKVDALLPVLFGEAMTQALTDSNFVPAPKNIRENFIRKLDKKN